jgi:Divergent InlB B-repeat domain
MREIARRISFKHGRRSSAGRVDGSSLTFPQALSSAGLLLLLLATVLGGALTLRLSPAFASGSSTALGEARPLAEGSATIQITSFTPSETLSNSFWGTTLLASSPTSSNTSLIVNATPAHEVVWPGGFLADVTDIVNSTIHGPGGGVQPAATSTPSFVAWCRSVGCHAIFQVPGEIDSPSTAAADVRYVEDTLGFHPDLWEIGNEPALWTNFGLPWSEWTSQSTPPPTPAVYAALVHRYIVAMRSVDLGIRIVGLPGIGHGSNGETKWLSATVAQNGPNLSAVAIHVYPVGLGPQNPSNATLTQFYSTLGDAASLPARVPPDEAAVRAACPGCPPIPILVTEFGSAVRGGVDSGFVSGFPQVPYITAEVAQAVRLNLTQLVYFPEAHVTPGAWFSDTGVSRPVYQLYAEVFSRLGTAVLPTRVTASIGGVYALATAGGSGTSPIDLLVANTNATDSIGFSITATGLAAAGPIETWTWNESTAGPVATYWPDGLPSSWELPASSIVLFEQARTPSYPLTVVESGLPSAARWFVQVGNDTATSNTTTLTYFLPSGQYDQATYSTQYVTPTERRALVLPTEVTVSGSPVTENATYGTEFLLNASASPASGGSASPSAQWVLNGSSATISATSATGYRFVGWEGSGPGSYTGPSDPASLRPTGPVQEVAEFESLSVSNYLVSFAETGLPSSSPWSVIVGNVTLNGTTSTLSVPLPDGSYPFAVAPVPGYSATPASGEVTVTGANVTVDIAFQGLARGMYQVWFNETGLPTGTSWTVQLNGSTSTTTSDSIAFVRPNGTYDFSVDSVPGYTADPSEGTVRVAGAVVTMTITFASATSPAYPIWFNESGLPRGTVWEVNLGDQVDRSGSSSLRFVEGAGTYSYAISAVGNWLPTPEAGNLTVSMGRLAVPVTFEFDFGLTFLAPPGIAPGTVWSVSLSPVGGVSVSSTTGGVVNRSTTGSSLTFDEPNGTYWYVVSVTGHAEYLQSGAVTVSGQPQVVSLPAVGSPPVGSGSTGGLLYVLIAVGLVTAAALILLLVWRQGRRPPRPSRTSEGPSRP